MDTLYEHTKMCVHADSRMRACVCACKGVHMHSRKHARKQSSEAEIWLFEYSIWMVTEAINYLNGKRI